MWDSGKIAALIGGELWGNPQTSFQGFVIDSRKVSAGQAFVAFKGEKTDGHAYIQEAFKAGASLVIAESRALKERGLSSLDVPAGKALIGVNNSLRALQELAAAWRTELNPLVVGITGSNGKTTTKDMVAAVLGAKYQVHKNVENQNNEIGLPLTILNAGLGTEVLVLEMGMRGLGQIKDLCNICRPSVGVITNIGTTHLELLGSLENIAQAKWELIESLPQAGKAILNAEDYFSVVKGSSYTGEKIYYGIEGKYTTPTVQGGNIRPCGSLGTAFEVLQGDFPVTVRLPLPGEHNVLDALAALAVGKELGVSFIEGAKALEELELSRMRLEVMEGIRNSVIFNDVYNANPISMKASLQVLAERGGDQTIAILGDMYELGTATLSGHRGVGRQVSELGIKELITVGELAREIATGARESGFPKENIRVCNDCEEAAHVAREVLKEHEPGFWVLVKGSRGLRMERISQWLMRDENPV
ncbi:MAG: UDP-N-acetylmuramoyl-tripeptide--D-alanyl-D-alanine ligase [Desulfitobacteriia bacterium]|jgi:UDP-N-acetylmuramoyl-tripeptide--D-alanyl-D-alanine ligase